MTPYLYAHPNRYAPVRANGIRFHGYPGRTRRPDLIAVHTAESAFDRLGEDGGAEAVARFQSTTDRPSSYHRIADRDSVVVCLPDEATAFGVAGYNSRALSVSLAMRAADWSDPAVARAAEPMLARAAAVTSEWCSRWEITPRLLTKPQADAGWDGIIGHGRLDPGRRSDPGTAFPWARFLELVKRTPIRPPVPTSEDEQMFTFRDDRSGISYLLSGGRVFRLHDTPDLVGMTAAKVPSAGNLTAPLCDELLRAYSPAPAPVAP